VTIYESALSRLLALKPELFAVTMTPFSDQPTYARRSLNIPHRPMAHWVFNRRDFVGRIARALHDEGVKDVAVTVIANPSKLDQDSFWYVMENRDWTHPGRRI
jgi:hypothetical protein